MSRANARLVSTTLATHQSLLFAQNSRQQAVVLQLLQTIQHYFFLHTHVFDNCLMRLVIGDMTLNVPCYLFQWLFTALKLVHCEMYLLFYSLEKPTQRLHICVTTLTSALSIVKWQCIIHSYKVIDITKKHKINNTLNEHLVLKLQWNCFLFDVYCDEHRPMVTWLSYYIRMCTKTDA